MSKDQTTTQMSRTQADPTTLNRESAMWDRATELANSPYQAYTGQRVAGFTPDQLAGFDAARAAAGAGTGTVQSGINLTGQAGAYQPLTVGANPAGPAATASSDPLTALFQMFTGPGGPAASARDVSAQTAASGINQYLNPWTDAVVNSGLSDLDLARQRAVTQGAGAATAAGAFGGSRHGVADSLTNEAALREAANLSANTRAAGFNTALGAATNDANRNLTGQMANQSADVATGIANAGNQTSLFGSMMGNLANLGMFNAGQLNNMGQFNANLAQNADVANAGNGLTANAQRLAAGGQLGSLGQTQQNMGLIGADALTKIGGMQQGLDQANKDVAYEDWLRKQADPFNKLMFQQGFTGTPGSVSVSRTTQEGSPVAGLLGAASTIASIPGVSTAISNMFGSKPVNDYWTNPMSGVQG